MRKSELVSWRSSQGEPGGLFARVKVVEVGNNRAECYIMEGKRGYPLEIVRAFDGSYLVVAGLGTR